MRLDNHCFFFANVADSSFLILSPASEHPSIIYHVRIIPGLVDVARRACAGLRAAPGAVAICDRGVFQ